MFFIFFPGGLERHNQRGLVAYMICAAMLYRMLLGLRFPQLQVEIVRYFPGVHWNWEVLSAVLQSAVTPVFPAGIYVEHGFLLGLAVPLWVLFWISFGRALEEDLGRIGLAVFWATGVLLGLLLAMMPGVAMSAAFWLGHAATVFCIGAACALYYDEEVRIHYASWIIWAGVFHGTWKVPALFLLVPMLLVLTGSQSMFWYSVPLPAIATHDGLLTPLGWNLLLAMAGFGAAVGWRQVVRKKERGRRSAPERAY